MDNSMLSTQIVFINKKKTGEDDQLNVPTDVEFPWPKVCIRKYHKNSVTSGS